MDVALESVRSEKQSRGLRRILLAEDDSELRSLLAFSLESDGYEVVQAEDGLRLSEYHLSRGPIDAVIADVKMPGRSGVEAFCLLRRVDASTPFVLITAFGSDDLHEQARALGVTAVFDKPFDLDELRSLMRWLAPLAEPDSAEMDARIGQS
jgi:DNA-binding response OmpR family regulator